MEQIRRLLPRQFADWRAKCMFGDDPEERWHDCRVVDVSSAGAGLELPETKPEDIVGSSVIVVIQLRGTSQLESWKDSRHANGYPIRKPHRVGTLLSRFARGTQSRLVAGSPATGQQSFASSSCSNDDGTAATRTLKPGQDRSSGKPLCRTVRGRLGVRGRRWAGQAAPPPSRPSST
jgi:hypothetical protein